MGKINLLEPGVFNMLAAGEVVERPASVIKELVENSIDAGASVVDISVEQGGIRQIKVSDNGIGILPEDMRSAFLPHATSKLKYITDLDSVSTLGFRGEALASIASVSEISAVSRARGADGATKLVLRGGEEVSFAPDSRQDGTTIVVDNLFFNTPARLKFLKKPQAELRYVVEVVKALILANPSVAITLTGDQKELISSEGGTLWDAVCAVYGASVASRLLPIEGFEHNGIRIEGYVSPAEISRSNRGCQTVIVNGRAVQDATVQTACEKAYGDLLMTRCFPIFVLELVLPFDDVDVNVHPSKTEVRFADRQQVFSAVYHAVYDAVHSVSNRFDIPAKREASVEENDYDVMSMSVTSASSQEAAVASDREERGYKPKFTHVQTEPMSFGLSRVAPRGYGGFDPSSERLRETAIPADFLPFEERGSALDGRIVGQIFATYIIVEKENEVYLIDQHAAHERVIYDKISAKMTPEYSQPMLIPFKLSLTAEESERFETLIDSLIPLGFSVEQKGGTFYITAVPEPVARLNLGRFFADFLKNATEPGGVTLASMMRESLCQQACKAAIKGGDSFDNAQLEAVIESYLDESGALPEKCPHGRPAVIAFTKQDIEKLFKRIV